MLRFWRWLTGRSAVWEVMWGRNEGRIRFWVRNRQDKMAMDKADAIVTQWLRQGWTLIRHPGVW